MEASRKIVNILTTNLVSERMLDWQRKPMRVIIRNAKLLMNQHHNRLNHGMERTEIEIRMKKPNPNIRTLPEILSWSESTPALKNHMPCYKNGMDDD